MSWLRLTATSNCFAHPSYTYTNSAHWYAVHWHMVAALHSYYTHPTWLRFWGSRSLVESNDVITSWLRLTVISNCFLHPSYTYTHSVSTLICCPLAYGSSLTQLIPSYLGQILEFWVTRGVKMMWLCHGWGWQPPQTAYHIHIKHVESGWLHWYEAAAARWRQQLGGGGVVCGNGCPKRKAEGDLLASNRGRKV